MCKGDEMMLDEIDANEIMDEANRIWDDDEEEEGVAE